MSLGKFHASAIPVLIQQGIMSLLVTTLITLTGCNKDPDYYPSPKISISAVSINSLTGVDISLEVYLGEGQKLKGAKLVFEDLTLLSSAGFEKPIELTNDRKQSHSVNVQTDLVNHDFAVHAILEMGKYTYSSEKKIVRFPKNNFLFKIVPADYSGDYSNLDNTVGAFLNSGNRFGLEVYFQNKFICKSVEVKLNNTVTTSLNYNFEEYVSESDGSFLSVCDVTVPASTPPGDYEVDVYIDGNKFVAYKKIRILSGNYNEYSSNYPGEHRFKYSHFIIGDKLYVIGGNFGYVELIRSPVWAFDLRNKTWTAKNDVSLDGSKIEEIYPFSLQSDGIGYIFLRNNGVNELWRYNDQDDTWQKITNYPGSGTSALNGFIIGKILYVGGGYGNVGADGYSNANDFWSFDLGTQEWTRRNDVRYDRYFICDATCTNETRAYIYVSPARLLEYDSATDIWSEKARFPGPIRYGVSIVLRGSDLYLFGGMNLEGGSEVGFKDSFTYSITNNQWNQNAFIPCFNNRSIAFVYNNKIIFGLGYANDIVPYTDHTLYQFNP